MASVDPVTVITRSGTAPSLMCILADDSSLMELMISPPLPIIEPTSLPLINILRVRETVVGESDGEGGEDMMMEILLEQVVEVTQVSSGWLEVSFSSGCLEIRTWS